MTAVQVPGVGRDGVDGVVAELADQRMHGDVVAAHTGQRGGGPVRGRGTGTQR